MTLLRALREQGYPLSIIINGFDDGFSTGLVRRVFPTMLGPSDFRKVCMGLSRIKREADLHEARHILVESARDVLELPPLFEEAWARIENQGKVEGYKGGCAVGNAVFAAYYMQFGSSQRAIDEYAALMHVSPDVEVIAASEEPTALSAMTSGGGVITSEDAICWSPHQIKHLMWTPGIRASERALAAVRDAKMVIYAPGTFFSSLLPSVQLLAAEIGQRAVWLVNQRAEAGTQGYTWLDLYSQHLKFTPRDVIMDPRSDHAAPVDWPILPTLADLVGPDGLHDGERTLDALRKVGL